MGERAEGREVRNTYNRSCNLDVLMFVASSSHSKSGIGVLEMSITIVVDIQ